MYACAPFWYRGWWLSGSRWYFLSHLEDGSGLKLEDDEAVLRERNWGGVNNNEVVVNGQSQDGELISRRPRLEARYYCVCVPKISSSKTDSTLPFVTLYLTFYYIEYVL